MRHFWPALRVLVLTVLFLSKLSASPCESDPVREPSFLDLSRIVTRTMFVGEPEFGHIGTNPRFYRTISYSGSWSVSSHEYFQVCPRIDQETGVTRPLEGGGITVRWSGSTDWDITGEKNETGIATQDGYSDIYNDNKETSMLIGGFPTGGFANVNPGDFRNLNFRPFDLTSEDPLARVWSTPGAVLSCPGKDMFNIGAGMPSSSSRIHGTELTGVLRAQLSVEDTVDDALTYWNERGGSQFVDYGNDAYFVRNGTDFRNLRIARLFLEAEFDACKDERLTAHFTIRRSTTGNVLISEETREQLIVGNSSGKATLEVEIRAEEGERVSFIEVYATSDSACSKNVGNGHETGGAVGSIHWYASLGTIYEGRSAGYLRIYQDDWNEFTFTPKDLEFTTQSPSLVRAIRDLSGKILQVVTPKDVFNVSEVSNESYQIAAYPLESSGTPDPGSGLYLVSGSPHTSFLISKELVGSEERLRIVESGLRSSTTDFAYVSVSGVQTWKMYEGNGARLTERVSQKLTSVPTGLESKDFFSKPTLLEGSLPGSTKWAGAPVYYSEIDQVKDSAGLVVEKYERIYQHIVVGTGLTRQFFHLGQPTPTTTFKLLRRERFFKDDLILPHNEVTYFFGTDVTQSKHVRLIRSENTNGEWKRFDYDDHGNLSSVESSFQGSTLSDLSSENRLVTYEHTTLNDIDLDGKDESLIIRTESVFGQNIERSFEIGLSNFQTINGILLKETQFIEGVTPSANWDTVGNLTERSWVYANPGSEFYQENYARSRADGTGNIWFAERQSDGTLDITYSEGALLDVSAPSSINAGLETIKQFTEAGVLLNETTTDIESNLVVAQSIYSDFDDYGRPRRVDYLDKTFETRQYTCCGLQSVTDRNGITTYYDYDSLARVEYITSADDSQAERVEYLVYDAADNLKERYVGIDQINLNLSESYDYDYSGNLVNSRERYLDSAPMTSRQTITDETFGSSLITETTTRPNGSTYIIKRYIDGSLFEVSGTGVHGQRTSYAVENDASLGYPVFTETTTNLFPDGSPSDEILKTYFDALGRVYKTEVPSSNGGDAVTQYSFSPQSGRLKSVEDPDGQILLYGYNSKGDREVVALDTNQNGIIDYDGTDRITRTRHSFAIRSQEGESYTVDRQIIEVWDTVSQDVAKVVSQVDRSLNGLADGNFGSIRWETAYSRTTTAETILNRSTATVTSTVRQSDGSFSTSMFVDGLLQTETQYHSDGSILSQFSYSYDSSGENRVDYITDLYNGTTDYDYYADGQLKQVITPDPDEVQTGPGYERQQTSYTYTDTASAISRVSTFPDNSIQSETFYPTGELSMVTGSQTFPVAYSYDHAGRLQTQTTWQNATDPATAVITAWKYYPNGRVEEKLYDALIALDGTISGTRGNSYTYTDGGRLLTSVNGRGITTSYDYHPTFLDLIAINYDDGLTPGVSNSDYDRQGRPTQISDASGNRVLNYENGQLMDETFNAGALAGFSLDRRQDNLERIDQLVLRSGQNILHQVDYQFDGASRLESVIHGAHTVTYAYDPSSELRQTLTFNNGSSNILKVEERRDSLNRLKSLKTLDSSLVTLSSHSYLYDNLNRRTRNTGQTGDYWSYSYDSLGQVDTAAKYNSADMPIPGYGYGFTFDDMGNRMEVTTNGRSASYSPNDLNQYDERAVPRAVDIRGSVLSDPSVSMSVNNVAVAPQSGIYYHALDLSAGGDSAQQVDVLVTAALPDGGDGNAPRVADAEKSVFLPSNPEDYGYDADGNLDYDGKWDYTWDAENRLVKMETLAIAYTAGAPRERIEFGYDSQGRRFSKKASIWNTATNNYQQITSTLYLYDGWNLIAEIDAMNLQLQTSYFWGTDLSGSMQGAGGVGGLLLVLDQNGSTAYPAYDGHGNVIGYFDAQNGGRVAEFEYGPFGELIRATGSKADEFDFRFSTKPLDQETGLVAYQLRYYNPETGRWLSRDPIGEEGGPNLYGFNGNDGINRWDYLGLIDCRCLIDKSLIPPGMSEEDYFSRFKEGYNNAINLERGDYHTALRQVLEKLQTNGNVDQYRLSASDVKTLIDYAKQVGKLSGDDTSLNDFIDVVNSSEGALAALDRVSSTRFSPTGILQASSSYHLPSGFSLFHGEADVTARLQSLDASFGNLTLNDYIEISSGVKSPKDIPEATLDLLSRADGQFVYTRVSRLPYYPLTTDEYGRVSSFNEGRNSREIFSNQSNLARNLSRNNIPFVDGYDEGIRARRSGNSSPCD